MLSTANFTSLLVTYFNTKAKRYIYY